MSACPTEGIGATMGGARPVGDAVTLALLPPETGATLANDRHPDWRVMLFFHDSAKGFRCLPTLQRTKNTSHDEIRLK